MSKTSFAALGLIETLNQFPLSLLVTGYDHLSNTLTVVNHKILLGKIDEDNTNLATVVSVDGTRGVEYGNPLLQSQAATGANLSLVTSRKRNTQTRGNKTTLERMEHDGFIDTCTKINTSREVGGVLGQVVMTLIDNLYLHNEK